MKSLKILLEKNLMNLEVKEAKSLTKDANLRA